MRRTWRTRVARLARARKARRDRAGGTEVERQARDEQRRYLEARRALLDEIESMGYAPHYRTIPGGREIASARCGATFACTMPLEVFVAWYAHRELPDPVRFPLHHRAAADPEALDRGEWVQLLHMPHLW